MKKKLANVLTLLLTSLIWLLIGWTLHSQWERRTTLPQSMTTTRIDKVWALLQNKQYRFSEIPEEQFAYVAIRGMLAASQDHYAVLFAPPASTAYAADIGGELGVPGIWKAIVNEKMVITRLTPGMGAERAGLKVGDILLGVNAIRFDEMMTLDEASILLRGPIGATNKVSIQRGQALLQYDVPLDATPILTSHVISGQIGYLQQALFTLNAPAKMQQQLQALVDQKVKALIWDLRDNNGGAIQATESILNHFMADGVFYRAEFKNGEQQVFSANGSAQFVQVPLVVLINENTYSAGEIAAAALGDNQRAVLIGTPTEGKGTIQDTFTLDDQHLLRITIAKWLSPSGEWMGGKGVTPTFTVQDDPATAADEVLEFAVQYVEQEFLVQ